MRTNGAVTPPAAFAFGTIIPNAMPTHADHVTMMKTTARNTKKRPGGAGRGYRPAIQYTMVDVSMDCRPRVSMRYVIWLAYHELRANSPLPCSFTTIVRSLGNAITVSFRGTMPENMATMKSALMKFV